MVREKDESAAAAKTSLYEKELLSVVGIGE